ncbi:MAG: glycosyltransferase family 61 protein [Pseudomonadota bacterium]|uniref:glycosyltransferase family 61 protein n=1 Tax=Roseovarius salincola TaxID=2978479 RepID=UPI0022A751CF|nr:glycosyltransferase 61 family protein [Roseovarius sp. EGI FJ00037]MCZ0811239.1 glycosyltransferase 61 family protein [Roseovarius sp. EGI FJ00037]
MNQISGKVTFDPYECPEGRLITACSHLVDRFVPDCERITLPAKHVGGGSVSFEKKPLVARPPNRPRRRFLSFRPATVKQQRTEKTFIDFRRNVPQNWAHFLNNHLPILFVIAQHGGFDPSQILVVLPGSTPDHICRAAELFGIETLCTDTAVQGGAFDFEVSPWTGIRAIRSEWARLPFVGVALDSAGIRDGVQGALPEKAFISRRKTRRLENEATVEAFLTQRGFTKVYPEELSVSDQFKLFEQAEQIVSIHGAALAPLLYRSRASRLESLIELFPCGHMTDVYRVMCHQVGCKWIGVRGKIKPEHVRPAYDLTKPFLKYSLQSFEIDLQSLEVAMEMV